MINSPFIFSTLSNPFNTIIANAFEGDGGNINITTNTIFGGEFLVIDASSQFGLDGEVIINDPNVNPTSGLTEVKADFVDAESLINQNACAFEGDKIAGGSSFILKGKGGLPARPEETISNDYWLLEWASPESEERGQIDKPLLVIKDRKQEDAIVWSQLEEWLLNAEDKIALTVEGTSKFPPYSPTLVHPSCSGVANLK